MADKLDICIRIESYNKYIKLFDKYKIIPNYKSPSSIYTYVPIKTFICINNECVLDDKIQIYKPFDILHHISTYDDEKTVEWFMEKYETDIINEIDNYFKYNCYQCSKEFEILLKLPTTHNYALSIIRLTIKPPLDDKHFGSDNMRHMFENILVIFKNSSEDKHLELLITVARHFSLDSIPFCIYFFHINDKVKEIINYGITQNNYKMLKYMFEAVLVAFPNDLKSVYEELFIRSLFHKKIEFYEGLCPTPVTDLTYGTIKVFCDDLTKDGTDIQLFGDFYHTLQEKYAVEFEDVIGLFIKYILEHNMLELFASIFVSYPIIMEKEFIDYILTSPGTDYQTICMNEKNKQCVFNSPDKDEIIDMVMKSKYYGAKANQLLHKSYLHPIFFEIFFEVRLDNQDLMKMM